MRFASHADKIIAAAVEDIFSRDLRSKHIESVLEGYAGALRAIGAL